GVPAGFDPLLHRIGFSFKVECPSPLDCAPTHECPPAVRDEPELDYLAKDYASFRRLILDRLSVLMPGWRERRAADFTVTLAELLAYAGDRLSYFQDAVAGEAYLGTARRRVSLRRHARLLDYHVHEGRNARAWLCFTVSADAERTGAAEALPVPAGARIIVATPPLPENLPPGTDPDDAWFLAAGAVFEPVTPVHGLYAAHNRIAFHTWGDTRCCLPRGATRALRTAPTAPRRPSPRAAWSHAPPARSRPIR
ncbi:MAG TPA: putative baseplate assembly protein, partial [Verrucomicrobiota bacterium]|nr:putative baseplate assembly protein [Verrucomicrobiota bacterium]